MRDRREVGAVLRKTDRKRSLGRYMHRFVEILQLFFRQTGRYGAELIDLAQDRDTIRTVVKAAVHIRVA
jgi:hypothetical protein